MLEDLKYPFKEQDTIPMWAVPIFAVILPCTVFLIYYYYRRDVYDLHHAILGIMYSVLVTAVITDSIKDAVGRPRPNFFYRPLKLMGTLSVMETLKLSKKDIKAFPVDIPLVSRSFAGLAFLSWYLCGKVKAFDRRGHAAKLCIVLLPLLFAALVGISRIDDYWHHWTDVFTGSIIGTVVASLCYLLFFPFPHEINGWAPHASIKMREKNFQSTSIEMDNV
ncbi:hypothetical protein RND71_008577 [Anisodus tanguticus]|uniref:Phosphatidic acid phosphatase type 2/haloperoxidase domain-containing protein n=1 Tax=Anisodus tanguticus TaxID=243964 RepID=A0AAE1VK31_9SOLA|nr:hypothetical protein RND71_008577 [Anisodus tanguticus]